MDDVNGVGFWHEKGRIKNTSIGLANARGNPAVMKVVNHWQDADANSKGRRPAQPVVVPAESSLRLRYAIYVHSGDAKVGQVASVYREYVATPESPSPPVPAQCP